MTIDNIEVIKEIPISQISYYKINKKVRFFLNKGLDCPICGAKGKFFAVCKQPGQKYASIRLVAKHINRYVFMTADHIHPKSKGGTNKSSNLQPMCHICNNAKGDKSTIKKYVGFLVWVRKEPEVRAFVPNNVLIHKKYKRVKIGEIFASDKKQARKIFKRVYSEKISFHTENSSTNTD